LSSVNGLHADLFVTGAGGTPARGFEHTPGALTCAKYETRNPFLYRRPN
jgi:hypothetical protein